MSAKYWDDPWNVLSGCTKTSLGCMHCYAERLAATRLAGNADYLNATTPAGRWSGAIRLLPHKLDIPLRTTASRVYFVCNTSDLYHEQVPFPFIAAVYAVMAACPQHTFLISTKWPDRRCLFQLWAKAVPDLDGFEDDRLPVLDVLSLHAMEFVGSELWQRRLSPKALRAQTDGRWPLPNVWEGTTIEHPRYLGSRLEALMLADASHRWVSAEPLVEDPSTAWDNTVNWLMHSAIARPATCTCGHDHAFMRCPNYGGVSEHCHHAGCTCPGFVRVPGTAIDWIALGGESGPDARPCPVSRMEVIANQARRAHVGVYLKQYGSRCGAHLHTAAGRGRHLYDGDGQLDCVLKHPTGADPAEWPSRMRSFREMPWSLRQHGPKPDPDPLVMT